MASLRLRAFPDRGFLVWFALTAGIATWLVHLVAFAAIVEFVHDHGRLLALLRSATASPCVVTLVALWLSWLMARSGDDSEEAGTPAGRIRFLGSVRPAHQRDQPDADPPRGQLHLLHPYRWLSNSSSSWWSSARCVYARGLTRLWHVAGARPDRHATAGAGVRGRLRRAARRARAAARLGRDDEPARAHGAARAAPRGRAALARRERAVHGRHVRAARRGARRRVQPAWRGVLAIAGAALLARVDGVRVRAREPDARDVAHARSCTTPRCATMACTCSSTCRSSRRRRCSGGWCSAPAGANGAGSESSASSSRRCPPPRSAC